MSSPEPIVRHAARVLLLDDDGRILLFRVDGPVHRPGTNLWITPGGGINDGEQPYDAAVRELWEETGLTGIPLSTCAWVRDHTFAYQGGLLRQVESYFVARTACFEPSRDNFEAHEHAFMHAHRWWAVPEIASSTDYFAPRSLARLLPDLIAGNIPAQPIDCGI
jgi:8-oxo-dGTP pyrophosphatase MutT (NUDIX family)